MIKYLKIDVTGQSSGTEYGKIGDAVVVLSTAHEMWVVRNSVNAERFNVFPDDLSDTPVEIKTNNNEQRKKVSRRN